MLVETEIKLRLSSKTKALLMQHSLITERLDGEWQTVNLYNQYFDTASLELDKANMALRLRRDGEQIIQTLKGRGRCVGGLFVRNESDWYIDEYALKLDLLDKNCWPDTLEDVDKTSISPIFSTNFKRTKALLKWCWKGQAVEVEVALDEGAVETNDAQDLICELELEIRHGPVDALLELAVELASELSLFPSSISKAERGYRLLKAGTKQLETHNFFTDKDITIDDAIAYTGETLLGRLQRSIESVFIAPELDTLQHIQQQLTLLDRFLSGLGSRITPKEQQLFQSTLDAVATDTQTLLQSNLSLAQLAPEFERYLTKPRWGFLCLRLSKWCLLKEWQQSVVLKQTAFSNTCIIDWLKELVSADVEELAKVNCG
jgi:triphosphatase